MSDSRYWHPWRRWWRSKLLEWINRWLPEVTTPAPYRAVGNPREHHGRRRRLWRKTSQRLRQGNHG